MDVIGYYFDISRGNGIEENIPYYYNLYLDIIYSSTNNNFIAVDDEDELLETLNTGNITIEEFNIAKDECSSLVNEIKQKKNIFINMDKKALINRYFG